MYSYIRIFTILMYSIQIFTIRIHSITIFTILMYSILQKFSKIFKNFQKFSKIFKNLRLFNRDIFGWLKSREFWVKSLDLDEIEIESFFFFLEKFCSLELVLDNKKFSKIFKNFWKFLKIFENFWKRKTFTFSFIFYILKVKMKIDNSNLCTKMYSSLCTKMKIV